MREQFAQAKATLAAFGLEGIPVDLNTFYRLSYGQIAAELNRQFAEKAREIEREPYTEAKIKDAIHKARQNPAVFDFEGMELYLSDHHRLSHGQIAAELNRQFAEKAREIEREPYTEAKIKDAIHKARQNPMELSVPAMIIAVLTA